MKGYCQMGDIQTGFAILKRMKEEGSALLQEMQRDGVKPSNYTLSILVKMMSRARRLDGAFAIMEEISRKYQIRLNVHVYTNLILACTSNRSLQRGMLTLEQMATEGVNPDSRTYTILIRSCLQGGRLDDAAGLLRAALGLPEPLPILSTLPAKSVHLDSNFVSEILWDLAGHGRGQYLATLLISDIEKYNPRIRIHADTHR